MTLLELLVKELPKRGGWPDGAAACCRHKGSDSIDFYDASGNWGDDCYLKYGKDFAKDSTYEPGEDEFLQSISREQYEAALAYSKTEWDGEGLPPVGCEVECIPGMLGPASSDDNKPLEPMVIKVVAHDKYPNNGNDVAIGVWFSETGGMRSSVFSPLCLVNVRTEADKKRDAAIAEMCRKFGIQPETAAGCYDISLLLKDK